MEKHSDSTPSHTKVQEQEEQISLYYYHLMTVPDIRKLIEDVDNMKGCHILMHLEGHGHKTERNVQVPSGKDDENDTRVPADDIVRVLSGAKDRGNKFYCIFQICYGANYKVLTDFADIWLAPNVVTRGCPPPVKYNMERFASKTFKDEAQLIEETEKCMIDFYTSQNAFGTALGRVRISSSSKRRGKTPLCFERFRNDMKE